jgi:hypothetical protein
MKNLFRIFILISILIPSTPLFACDPCSLYNASRLLGHEEGSFTLSISEQYTRFKSVEDSLRPRDGEIGRDFSVTQLAISYDLLESLGIQLTLPLLYRTFDTYSRFTPSRDSEFGIGDGVVSLNYTPLTYRTGEWLSLLNFSFGIKLPTGDTGSLGNIPSLSEDLLTRHAQTKHHPVSGALGGRALSLGSGSTDFLFGISYLTRFKRLLFIASAQYSHRNKGSFDYTFGNDLVWSIGPGYYVYVKEDFSFALRGVLSGEYKEKDTFESNRVARSGINNTYVGPEAILTIGDQMVLDVGIDALVSDGNTDSLIVPDFRVRSGVSYRF